MTEHASPQRTSRTWLLDIALLTLLCIPAYFLGLDAYGPSNWQESQRAVVARDMQQRDSLLVPTINGNPYLAKPPLIYWATIAVAEMRGTRAGLWELRFVAAVAGLAGVLSTYIVARRLLGGDRGAPPAKRVMLPTDWARSAAFWSALCLAGGILYFRSSRIGELDILLVPFVVIAIGAIAHAWRFSREHGRIAWGALLLAAIASAGAALTKGPPGLLIIALGGYGGMLLIAAFEPVSADSPGPSTDRARGVVFGLLLGIAAGFTALVRREPGGGVVEAILGSLLIALIVGALVAIVIRALQRKRRGVLWGDLYRTHAVGVPLAGAAAFGLWAWFVRRRIGGLAEGSAAAEAEDNLRVLVAESPLNNLEAAAYGVGLGSIGAILALVWLIKDRPVVRPMWWFVLAWAGLSMAAMSLLGKGVGRYLTPAWPAMAIMAGMFFATLIADGRRPRAIAGALALVAIGLIGVQAWWYAMGRPLYRAEQTPRPLIAELRARYHTDPERLATLNFRTPAIDYEVGRWVQPVGEIGMRDAIAGGKPWTLAELAADLRARGPRTIFVQRPPENVRASNNDPLDALRAVNVQVEDLPTESVFLISGYKVPVVAVRVSAP